MARTAAKIEVAMTHHSFLLWRYFCGPLAAMCGSMAAGNPCRVIRALDTTI
ncbi:hypothetical protein KY888_001557 [Vibrio vulnificus]|uniref:hypothetical protein n=1 Tax=Vibrio vulnificus TaxID=672 RepID=UPI0018F7E46A|nr:hypothetical protein [Vibrio vulnificus]EHU4914577.1 hypothetical protein [Vibrio vulnificus]